MPELRMLDRHGTHLHAHVFVPTEDHGREPPGDAATAVRYYG